MSDDLIAFLKAWHDWATNGAPDDQPFCRADGLCGNALRIASGDFSASSKLYRELRAMFGLVTHPFGEADYYDRVTSRTQHKCPKRLAWVRERLVEAGELVA